MCSIQIKGTYRPHSHGFADGKEPDDATVSAVLQNTVPLVAMPGRN